MTEASQQRHDRTILSMSNRWTRSIYTGYSAVKHRIFLEILEHFQPYINSIMNGGKSDLSKVPAIMLDMSKIAGHNNYAYVRQALTEMTTQDIFIYDDTSFKGEIYRKCPLINGFDRTEEKRIVRIRMNKSIAQLLLHIDYKQSKRAPFEWRPEQYTQFDKETVRTSHNKYMFAMYTFISSWAERGGTLQPVPVEKLRQMLCVEEKYKGFDALNQNILKPLKGELDRIGRYSFNYSCEKAGKKVKAVNFKVYKNKELWDQDDTWVKICKMLDGNGCPHFAHFKSDERQEFMYLVNGSYDLDLVKNKLQHIHDQIEKNKNNPNPDKRVARERKFIYTFSIIRRDFPPPR